MGTLKMIMPRMGQFTCPNCKKKLSDVRAVDDSPDDFYVIVCDCGTTTGIEMVLGTVTDAYYVDAQSIRAARTDVIIAAGGLN